MRAREDLDARIISMTMPLQSQHIAMRGPLTEERRLAAEPGLLPAAFWPDVKAD